MTPKEDKAQETKTHQYNLLKMSDEETILKAARKRGKMHMEKPR